MQIVFVLRLLPLPLVAVTALWLAACQGSGTDKPVASWGDAESVSSEIAGDEQPDADPQVPFPTEAESGSRPSDDAGNEADNSVAETPQVANQSDDTASEGRIAQQGRFKRRLCQQYIVFRGDRYDLRR